LYCPNCSLVGAIAAFEVVNTVAIEELRIGLTFKLQQPA
jgi:hypothetical protein